MATLQRSDRTLYTHFEVLPPAGPRERPPFVWAWGLLAILWVTWTPFAFRAGAPIELANVPTNPVEMLANIILWVPVGLFVAQRARSRPVFAATIVGAVFSILIESGQSFVATRIVSPIDVVMNTFGAGGGALLARLVPGRRARQMTVWASTGLVALAVWGVAISSAVRVGSILDLSDWDGSHSVVVGDEVGGIRTYRGEIYTPRLCTQNGRERFCLDSGAGLAARQRFAEQAVRNQSVSMAATVVSHSDEQSGPTRIITFSNGAILRNVTLGQEGRSLVFRLQRTGPGPSRAPEFWLPDAIRAGETTHVSADFQRGMITLEASSTSRTRRASFVPGILRSHMLVRGEPVFQMSHLNAKAAFTAVVLFLPVGVIVASLFGVTLPAPLAVTSAAVASCGLLLVCDLWVGARPVTSDLLLVSAAGAVGWFAAGPQRSTGPALRPAP